MRQRISADKFKSVGSAELGDGPPLTVLAYSDPPAGRALCRGLIGEPGQLEAFDGLAVLLRPCPPSMGIDPCPFSRVVLAQSDDVMEGLVIQMIKERSLT